MATNTRIMACPPEAVFDVLAHGWLYPSWVVGSSRMRDVDRHWPAEGARITHSFGIWPVLIDDTTSVVEWDPPRRARLRARGWPMGEAYVVVEAKPRGEGCVVRMLEDAVVGPTRYLPKFLRDVVLQIRNGETLRRLAYLAEGGAS